MNLNKHHKEAIVDWVVADIPRVHSLKLEERVQKMIDDDIVKNAPPELAAIYKNPKLRMHLNINGTNMGYLTTSGKYVNDLPYGRTIARHDLSAECKEGLQQLADSAIAEIQAIETARQSLANSLGGIRTLKQFLEAYPELKKYAPQEQGKTSNLPAIANVMTDLMQLGWPKGGNEAKAA